MRIERLGGEEEVARRCADLVQEVLRDRPDAVLLLPAGRTPVPLYRELLTRHRRGALDLSRPHCFQLDELVGAAPADPRSFNAFLRRQLLAPAAPRGDRDHLLDGGAADPAGEILRHARALSALGPPDLVLLGIGRNGHVAFNEPGCGATAAARLVALAQSTVRALRPAFPDGPVPSQGLTLGLAEIVSAARIAIVATGAAKADVVAALLQEPPSESLPASLLRGHPDLCVLADQSACAQLQGVSG